MLFDLNQTTIIDLTHELHSEIPTWAPGCSFKCYIEKDYKEINCRVMRYELFAGTGTHMDAPSHFVKGGDDIHDIPIQNFVSPLCIIRPTGIIHDDYLISVKDIEQYEKRNGAISKNSFIAADTGWGKRWGDAESFRNVGADNQMHFPGFSPEAVKLLLERDIVGIGIDTFSADGSNMNFPVHHIILPAGKFIIENLANLDKVPESGAIAVTLPAKIRDGAESTCRCIALIY